MRSCVWMAKQQAKLVVCSNGSKTKSVILAEHDDSDGTNSHVDVLVLCDGMEPPPHMGYLGEE